MRKKPREKRPRTRWSKAKLEELIGSAIVDATDDEEQQMAFYTAIEEHVKFPFKTASPGGEVAVQGIGVNDEDEIVAVCLRGRERLAVPILDLPLPKPPPKGAEWIEAYRLWSQER
jgi:hypothetical protein